MSSSNNDYNHLKELGKSNFEIADGEADIRNWVVKNENGNILGEVNELIFDTTAKKAVFIVLDLDKNEFNLKERNVLLPLEYADVNEVYKNVVYKGLMPNELAMLPTYEKGRFTRNSIDLTRSTFLKSITSDLYNTSSSSSVATQHHEEMTRQTHSETGNLANSGGNSLTTQSDINNPDQKIVRQESSYDFSSPSKKPFTVVAVFEDSGQTQGAIDHLLKQGYTKNDVTVSTRQTDINIERHNNNENGIASFFKFLFNDDNEVRKYTRATEKGYVISVDVSSAEQAEEAATILDKHGSVDIKADQQNISASGENKGNMGTSRIFKRQTSNSI